VVAPDGEAAEALELGEAEDEADALWSGVVLLAEGEAAADPAAAPCEPLMLLLMSLCGGCVEGVVLLAGGFEVDGVVELGVLLGLEEEG
jgi:hypothetical protein